MIAYVFIGIKLVDIMMIWRIMASMMIICPLMFNGCLLYDVNGIHVDNACIPPIPFSL